MAVCGLFKSHSRMVFCFYINLSAADPKRPLIKLPNHPALSGKDDNDLVNIRVILLVLAGHVSKVFVVVTATLCARRGVTDNSDNFAVDDPASGTQLNSICGSF